uniref:Variant surface glycoprotein 1125.1552 n=1 Tax=Trypanosoma brucei TaxID=5691 RepID=A0A1J0R4N1_9TRYP|nr:variant surface glycoprotein 1125.1552 [Trypanosoma brucei]
MLKRFYSLFKLWKVALSFKTLPMKQEKFIYILLCFLALVTVANAANKNEQEFDQMCRLYKLLSGPITIPGLTISLRSDSTESANQITLGILDRAQKINMSVAEQPMVEVLTNADKYKNKAAIDGDATKKGYFNLKDDAELEKMRNAYKEVIGAQGAEKAFSKKYGRALEEKQRQIYTKTWKKPRRFANTSKKSYGKRLQRPGCTWVRRCTAPSMPQNQQIFSARRHHYQNRLQQTSLGRPVRTEKQPVQSQMVTTTLKQAMLWQQMWYAYAYATTQPATTYALQ